MIRQARFLISHRLYAVNPDTLTATQVERDGWFYLSGSVEAVWYRRKDAATRACLGSLRLWSHSLTAPVDLTDPAAVLTADLDGRYGGDCHGRWDGERYWGAEAPDVAARHLEVLRPMLTDYPALPSGFEGWWRF